MDLPLYEMVGVHLRNAMDKRGIFAHQITLGMLVSSFDHVTLINFKRDNLFFDFCIKFGTNPTKRILHVCVS